MSEGRVYIRSRKEAAGTGVCFRSQWDLSLGLPPPNFDSKVIKSLSLSLPNFNMKRLNQKLVTVTKRQKFLGDSSNINTCQGRF